jgi:hypothetical protein
MMVISFSLPEVIAITALAILTPISLIDHSLKLYDATFAENGELLGLYYEPVDESYERTRY